MKFIAEYYMCVCISQIYIHTDRCVDACACIYEYENTDRDLCLRVRVYLYVNMYLNMHFFHKPLCLLHINKDGIYLCHAYKSLQVRH